MLSWCKEYLTVIEVRALLIESFDIPEKQKPVNWYYLLLAVCEKILYIGLQLAGLNWTSGMLVARNPSGPTGVTTLKVLMVWFG